MKYKLPFRGLSLEIENKLLEYMYNKALDAFPNEVGGLGSPAHPGASGRIPHRRICQRRPPDIRLLCV